ncbi:MAG: hypothetical protein Q4E09_02190 [Eubacteriales bacterium]|nr:hypothetical protein [Eubacteriales bacterium]
MLIALLLLITCLALYFTGPLRSGLVILTCFFALCYFFFELWRKYQLRKQREAHRQAENALFAIPLSHISGLNEPKLEICYLMLKQPDTWVLRSSNQRLVLQLEGLSAIWVLEANTVHKFKAKDGKIDAFHMDRLDDEPTLSNALRQFSEYAWHGLILIEIEGSEAWDHIWAFRPLEYKRCFRLFTRYASDPYIKYPRLDLAVREELEGKTNES